MPSRVQAHLVDLAVQLTGLLLLVRLVDLSAARLARRARARQGLGHAGQHHRLGLPVAARDGLGPGRDYRARQHWHQHGQDANFGLVDRDADRDDRGCSCSRQCGFPAGSRSVSGACRASRRTMRIGPRQVHAGVPGRAQRARGTQRVRARHDEASTCCPAPSASVSASACRASRRTSSTASCC